MEDTTAEGFSDKVEIQMERLEDDSYDKNSNLSMIDINSRSCEDLLGRKYTNRV